MISTETYPEFIARRTENAKARALAARTTIGAVPAEQLVSYSFLQAVIETDAEYAEWAVVNHIVEVHAKNGEPDDVIRVHAAGYLQERILAFSISRSTSNVANEVDNARLEALKTVLRSAR